MRAKSNKADLSGILKDGKRGNRASSGGGGSTIVQQQVTSAQAAQQQIQLTGPVTGISSTTGVLPTTITANAVGDSHLADMPAGTLKGRAVGAGTGDPGNLAVAAIIAILATGDGAGSGLDADFLDGLNSSAFQPVDADLTAIAALAGTGILARTGTNTWATRTLQAPAAGLTITNPAGIAGDPTFAFANDLLALESLASTGIAVRTGTSTWAQRSIVAGNQISVTNGDGVAGNITIAVTEGAGSGLDADTLDGVDSSGFIRNTVGVWHNDSGGTARLFFTSGGNTSFRSANGYSFQRSATGLVTFTIGDFGELGVKGAAYFESDLYIGPSYVAGIRSTGDVFAVRSGGGTGVVYLNSAASRYLYWDGANYRLDNAPLFVNGGSAWHSLNDGAGSGLDADLLDGINSSGFVQISGANVGFSEASVTMASASASAVSFQVQSAGSSGTAGPAQVAFHRPGVFAAHFGLDTDNRWKVGNWSYGANSYEILIRGIAGHLEGYAMEAQQGQTPSGTSTTIDFSTNHYQYREYNSTPINLAFTDLPRSGLVGMHVYNSSGGTITVNFPSSVVYGYSGFTVTTATRAILIFWYDVTSDKYLLLSQANAGMF